MSLQQQIRERANALTSLLSIQYPIIASPMMGVTTPAMVAAVSNAGGLGSLPCGVMTDDAITKAIADVRALTDKPFAVNLRVPPRQEPTLEATQTIFDALEPLRDELGAKHELATIPSFEEQFEAVLASDVPVVSFSFGGPREVFKAEAAEQACLCFSVSRGPCERGEGVLGFQTGSSESCMCARHRPRIVLSPHLPHYAFQWRPWQPRKARGACVALSWLDVQSFEIFS